MQIIKRRTDLIEEQNLELDSIGFNSKGVLTIKLKDDKCTNDILFNFKGNDLKILRRLLNQIRDKNE